MISILDYDAGNIKSVEKAVQYLGEEAVITRDRDVIYIISLPTGTQLLSVTVVISTSKNIYVIIIYLVYYSVFIIYSSTPEASQISS